MNKLCAVLCLTLICATLKGGEVVTNQVFVTDDGFSMTEGRDGVAKIKPEKIKEALKVRECLPAEKFPEGNWGVEQNGFQISMRLGSTNVTIGSPTVATILIRNVTNQAIAYRVVNILGQPGPIEICAEDDHGVKIDFPDDILTVISMHDQKIHPGTQRKYMEGLDKRLFNEARTIYVYASLKVGCPKCVDVRSAKTPIKIE